MALRNPEKLKVNNARLESYTEEYKEFSDRCKQMALARRKSGKIQVELMPKYLDAIVEYRDAQVAKHKPMTIAGVCLACGIGQQTYYKCVEGELDNIVDEYLLTHDNVEDGMFVDENGELQPILDPSDVFGRVSLMIQEQLEENIYTNKGNPAGSIFGLKARYQWKEDEPQTVNNTLVIANSEQAKKAMKLLND